MGDNLFDGGIDLNEIANSEEGTFDYTPPTVEPVNKEEEPAANPKEDVDPEELEGLSLEEIAALGEEGEADDDDDDNKAGATISKTPAEKESSPSNNTLTSLASALVEAGVFSSLEEDDIKEIESVDALIKAVEKQIKVNEYSALNEDQKEYLRALEAGVPLEAYSAHKANAAQYENLSDELIKENANVGYELIRRKFIIDGMDSEKAKRYAQLAMKEDNAVEEALSAKQALIQYEKDIVANEIKAKEDAKEAEKLKAQEELSSLKSKILETSEILPGIKINSITKEKVFDSITKPSKLEKDGTPLNEVMASYSDPEYKARLHAMHVITKGFTDFSKLERTSKSKAVRDLEEKLNTGNSIGKTGSPVVKGSTSSSLASALGDYVPAYKRS